MLCNSYTWRYICVKYGGNACMAALAVTMLLPVARKSRRGEEPLVRENILFREGIPLCSRRGITWKVKRDKTTNQPWSHLSSAL